ncbi:MAG: hypothetical protein IJW54_04175 [Clostridia bacterium]|nr:hypothetical protein [Clostridia bacterium]
MQLENSMAFAKTKIVCHGARATRIGERLLHKVLKYLRSTEFVKGNISENERKEMFNSISLKGLISYPDDVENLNTECDIIYQIIMGDDSRFEENLNLVTENSNGIPCIVFVIGEKKDEIVNNAYINVEEAELLDTFLDLFSVYTFPQEYGADFEELRPLFERKGEISAEKGEDFNLCVIRKATKEEPDRDVIQNAENSKVSFIITSRIGKEREIKYYSI